MIALALEMVAPLAPRPRFARPRRSLHAGYWRCDRECSRGGFNLVPGYFEKKAVSPDSSCAS